MGKNERKQRIERMRREIERRGGIVGSMTGTPDAVLEMFYQQVLDCPECRDHSGDDRRRDPFGH